uniref:Uncharacterized protein n=1 Tax=Strigamia maritima TaxID=126957 RepID=T1ISK2_STRMM
MSKGYTLFDDSDDAESTNNDIRTIPDSQSPKSYRKTRRDYLFETLTEENETEINENRKPFRSRINLPSTSGRNTLRTRQTPDILICSPQITPKFSRAGPKLNIYNYSSNSELEDSEELDNSPQVSPIPLRTNEKSKSFDYTLFSDNSQLEESEELDNSPVKRSSTPKTTISQNLKKKIAIKKVKSKLKLDKIDELSSSDDDFVPAKRQKRLKSLPKRRMKKKAIRKVEFSPIRKCPDDFIEHNMENPKYYLKDNIKSYDQDTSAGKRFQELKRINELRNVEVASKKKGEIRKMNRKLICGRRK